MPSTFLKYLSICSEVPDKSRGSKKKKKKDLLVNILLKFISNTLLFWEMAKPPLWQYTFVHWFKGEGRAKSWMPVCFKMRLINHCPLCSCI